MDFRNSHSTYSSSSLLKQGDGQFMIGGSGGFTRMENSEKLCSELFKYFRADNIRCSEIRNEKRSLLKKQ